MKLFKTAVIFVILLLINTACSRYIEIYSIVPDLILGFAAAIIVLDTDIPRSLLCVTVCGVFSGALSGRGVFFTVLMYVWTCTGMFVLRPHNVRHETAAAGIFTFCASAVTEAVYFLLNFRELSSPGIAHQLIYVFAPTVIYNTIAAVIICVILKLTVYREKKGTVQIGI